MLVLTRRRNERIQIGDDVVITVGKISGNRVRLVIDAPPEVGVKRTELCAEPEQAACNPRQHRPRLQTVVPK